MKLDKYLDKIVCITLINGYFYKGRVVDCDEDTITVLDVTNSNITLRPEAILTIREVNSNG